VVILWAVVFDLVEVDDLLLMLVIALLELESDDDEKTIIMIVNFNDTQAICMYIPSVGIRRMRRGVQLIPSDPVRYTALMDPFTVQNVA